MQNKTLSQLEIDGVPSFYIGMYGVCTHRMGLLDIPIWCKNPEAAINFINNYSQQKPKPKRWTVEDQKAGRLPEVGNHLLIEGNLAEFIGLSHASNSWCFRRLDGEWGIQTANKDWFSPIETPEEKAQRLREEWRIKALSSASILSGMQEYELKRLGGYIGDIYDALLSGELPMPGKDGE